MQPLVSIIIPNYNRANLIGETLQSIISQTNSNWECIVVDDGSIDDSLEVLKSFIEKDKRIKVYKRPQTMPKGANACRNYGLQLSKGSYVNWFDSDDLMHPDKLKLQLEGLLRSGNPYSVCQSLVFDESIENPIGLKSAAITSNQPFEDFLTKKIVWLTQAPLFNKQFLLKHQYSFDEELMAGQEWELFTRIMYNHRDYDIIEQPPLVYIRSHTKSISNSETNLKLYHYFLARLKIYNRFKNNLSADAIWHLNNYFLMSYKILLRNYSFSYAFKVYKQSLFMNDYFSVKQRFILLKALISYLLFKKGDGMLAKVQLWGKRTDLAFNNKEF